MLFSGFDVVKPVYIQPEPPSVKYLWDYIMESGDTSSALRKQASFKHSLPVNQLTETQSTFASVGEGSEPEPLKLDSTKSLALDEATRDEESNLQLINDLPIDTLGHMVSFLTVSDEVNLALTSTTNKEMLESAIKLKLSHEVQSEFGQLFESFSQELKALPFKIKMLMETLLDKKGSLRTLKELIDTLGGLIEEKKNNIVQLIFKLPRFSKYKLEQSQIVGLLDKSIRAQNATITRDIMDLPQYNRNDFDLNQLVTLIASALSVKNDDLVNYFINIWQFDEDQLNQDQFYQLLVSAIIAADHPFIDRLLNVEHFNIADFENWQLQDLFNRAKEAELDDLALKFAHQFRMDVHELN